MVNMSVRDENVRERARAQWNAQHLPGNLQTGFQIGVAVVKAGAAINQHAVILHQHQIGIYPEIGKGLQGKAGDARADVALKNAHLSAFSVG